MNTTTSTTAGDLPENEQEDQFVGIQAYLLGVMLQSLGCRNVFDGRKSQVWSNASSTAIPSATPITTPTATATIVLLAAATFATAATTSKSTPRSSDACNSCIAGQGGDARSGICLCLSGVRFDFFFVCVCVCVCVSVRVRVCVCACKLCFSAAIICACFWEFVQSAGLSGSIVGPASLAPTRTLIVKLSTLLV